MTTAEILEQRKLNEEVKADLNKIIRTLPLIKGDTSHLQMGAGEILNSIESNLLALEDMLYDKQH